MTYPDREGWYRWNEAPGISWDVEVYHGPNDALCVWCEDVGVSDYQQTFSNGDEMLGHIIVTEGEEDEWTYLRPLSS